MSLKAFTLTLSPWSSATYPDAVTLTAAGLPSGATATFSPATIAAGSGATPVTLTIQTGSQSGHNEAPLGSQPWAPVALGLVLLPILGFKSTRRGLMKTPRLQLLAAFAALFLALGSDRTSRRNSAA